MVHRNSQCDLSESELHRDVSSGICTDPRSGDHIYKMDYEVMLDFHKASQAAVSHGCYAGTDGRRPAVLESVVTDETSRITEFQEKPEEPKSNLASMGIYIFTLECT